MLRKIISIILILISVIKLFYDSGQVKIEQEHIEDIIENKIKNNKYDGYIYFKRLDYKLLIKSGDYNTILNDNLVLMMSNKSIIDKKYGNIILAGHNNKYVFSILYKINVGDEIVIDDFNKEYTYKVNKIDYVNIKDTSILDNVYDDKILTLITCTNNNQIRFVVTCKYLR